MGTFENLISKTAQQNFVIHVLYPIRFSVCVVKQCSIKCDHSKFFASQHNSKILYTNIKKSVVAPPAIILLNFYRLSKLQIVLIQRNNNVILNNVSALECQRGEHKALFFTKPYSPGIK